MNSIIAKGVKVIRRTYGWVQNPSNFDNLKRVVQIFDPSSEHYSKLLDALVPELIPFKDLKNRLMDKLRKGENKFSYVELVGTSKDLSGKSTKKRTDAVADGLIQISILPQSAETRGKKWTDNWTSDGYLRWALSFNFIQHDRETDICSITPKGLEFSQSTAKTDKDSNLIEAMLAYPPASRVLNILNDSTTSLNKFEIGEQLGFKGEKGFTSYPSEQMEFWFKHASREEQRKIRADIEGTADKYARMIAGWLEKLGFVEKEKVIVSTDTGEIAGFQKYSITAKGKHQYLRSLGSSKNKRIAKYVNWEFLAVDSRRSVEQSSRDYVRTRRAYILDFLSSTKSMKGLLNRLQAKGFKDSEKVIRNDISGLIGIGIRIEISGERIILKDKIIGLVIPPLQVTSALRISALDAEKNELIEATDLPPKYYALLDIARDRHRNRDFEMLTVDLFKTVYGFKGSWLGGARKPDGAIYVDSEATQYGIILDTKAYAKGYSKNIIQEDEMVRYIEDNQQRDVKRNSNEWWKVFSPAITGDNTYFLWVSSEFIGQFKSQLKDTYQRTKTHGGALSVSQLLLGADKISKSSLSLAEIPRYLSKEEVIVW